MFGEEKDGSGQKFPLSPGTRERRFEYTDGDKPNILALQIGVAIQYATRQGKESFNRRIKLSVVYVSNKILLPEKMSLFGR